MPTDPQSVCGSLWGGGGGGGGGLGGFGFPGGLWALSFQCGVQNLRESQPVKADVYVCCGVSGSFRLDFDCERAESTHQKYKSVTALSSLSLLF